MLLQQMKGSPKEQKVRDAKVIAKIYKVSEAATFALSHVLDLAVIDQNKI